MLGRNTSDAELGELFGEAFLDAFAEFVTKNTRLPRTWRGKRSGMPGKTVVCW